MSAYKFTGRTPHGPGARSAQYSGGTVAAGPMTAMMRVTR